MGMSVAAVMDGLGVRLRTIADLRVYDFPAANVVAPAAVVGFPDSLEYDATLMRGADRGTYPVFVMVGPVSDRGARDALSKFVNAMGAKSIKAAIEDDPTLGGAAQTTRVMDASVETTAVAGVDYLTARFNVDVVA